MLVAATGNDIQNPLFRFWRIVFHIQYELLTWGGAFQVSGVIIFEPTGVGPCVVLVVVAQTFGDVFVVEPQRKSPQTGLYIQVGRIGLADTLLKQVEILVIVVEIHLGEDAKRTKVLNCTVAFNIL